MSLRSVFENALAPFRAPEITRTPQELGKLLVDAVNNHIAGTSADKMLYIIGLLHSGADANTREGDALNCPVLTCATVKGHCAVVEELISFGADVNARNSGGVTALMLAVWNGYEDIVRVLVDNGADLHMKDDEGTSVRGYVKEGLTPRARKDESRMTLLLQELEERELERARAELQRAQEKERSWQEDLRAGLPLKKAIRLKQALRLRQLLPPH